MSAQDYARQRAVRLAATSPKEAFDLVLAADDLDKTAAKDPAIADLNRGLRKAKTEAVKYLNNKTPLVWDAGGTFDYIGLGSSFHLVGSAEVGGPSVARLVIDITAAREKGEGHYNIRVESKGKGGRSLTGDYIKEIKLDDIKTKPAMWLEKVSKALEAHLKGDLNQEKQQLLEYVDEAIKSLSEGLDEAKGLKTLIEKSDNLVADADDLRRKIPFIPDNLSGVRRLLDELKRAGG